MATLKGTAAVNTINGTSLADLIYGYAGDDTLKGGSGNDQAWGGIGNDRILGDAGNDVLYGEDGNDIISGGIGDDNIVGGNGNDKIYGDLGADKISGGAGDDYLEGNGAGDRIDGGIGYDIIKATQGTTVFGGADDDCINYLTAPDQAFNFSANNVIDGGSGVDTLVVTNSIAGTVTYATDSAICINKIGGAADNYGFIAEHTGVERLAFNGSTAVEYRGSLQDSPTKSIEVLGSAKDDVFYSGGNDLFRGGAGNDTFNDWTYQDIAPAVGKDVWYGGPGADEFHVRTGGSTVQIADYQAGIDKVYLDGHLVTSDADWFFT